MNIKLLKKLGIGFASLLVIVYAIFLIVPFIITPIANNYIPMINDEIKKATGLNSSIEGFKILTTPKLTVGGGFEKFSVSTPDDKEVFSANNFEIKMSLIPLLARRIELDLVKLGRFNAYIGLNKDGSFEIEKYFPKSSETTIIESNTIVPIDLPFGLKLSNHLPDMKLSNYDIEFIDISNNKIYEIEGDKTEITDLVLNKGFKLLASGKAVLDKREQFTYKLKVNNKVMPDLDLHELVFNPQATEKTGKSANTDIKINILDIFKGLYNYKLSANVDADLILTSEGNNGYLNLDKLSISPNGLTIPPSSIAMNLKGNKIDINSNLYTAENELSTLSGVIKTGRKPNVDLTFKSDVKLANIIKIINAFALTFNIKDLQTLSANGNLDADFNIKSDLKTISSDGYLKIPSANLKYGLYDVCIDDIVADIELNDNNINIKDVGFSVLSQPLKFYGTIDKNAQADLHLIANRLDLKGLLVAFGQAALLKENVVKSGTISINADIVGKLNNIEPAVKVLLNDINIENIPSNTSLLLPNTKVELLANIVGYSGGLESSYIKIINPAATVSIPIVKGEITTKEILLDKTAVKVENIDFNVQGKIKNYLSEKVEFDFVTDGDIISKLYGTINLIKQTLNLTYDAQNSEIVIPMFDKSRMSFNGLLSINGDMLNPNISGTVNVPSISIPEIPVDINHLVIKLNGPILNGYATAKKFASGGIVADDLTADISLKGENFYLNNLKGAAFDGKIFGNIICNISNLNTTVDFKGEGLDAEKTLEGLSGVSNTLTGSLDFDTKLSLLALEYYDMMRSLKGNLSFKITDGSFGSLGRVEDLFYADNVIGNSILKTTVSSLAKVSDLTNAAKYDNLSGFLTFSNGWAKIENIKSSGPSLTYYVTGKCNLITGATNTTVLGRMHSSLVVALGPLGELSADKLLNQIPKFGALTSSLVKTLTASPKSENTKEIPALTGATPESYKDFKFTLNLDANGRNTTTFKWLTDVDTSALDAVSVVDTVKSITSTVNTDFKNTVKGVKETVSSQKELLKNTATELKSLFSF